MRHWPELGCPAKIWGAGVDLWQGVQDWGTQRRRADFRGVTGRVAKRREFLGSWQRFGGYFINV